MMTAKPTHTPIHNVRVPDELWAAATVRAAERGESVSDVVRRALARYARKPTREVCPQDPQHYLDSHAPGGAWYGVGHNGQPSPYVSTKPSEESA